ncbi:MAG: matrixin family metalloprotease [Bdellovibrionales bacterium]|nr:matrixin family metalloprotease [Bdellovibrionales bacterium]
MKLRLGLSILLMVAIATLIQACSRPPTPQESCNFVQNPEQQRVSWKSSLPVKLYLHSSVPAEAYPVIDKAISEYNLTVGGGREMFKIVARGASGDMNPGRDGYSMIYWFGSWDKSRPTEQARTTIYWSGSEIFEADIRINAANFRYYFGEDTHFSEVDLNSLMVHEIGHVLGLAHNVTSGSVMNITLDQGQVRRRLGAMDQTSLKCEY